MLIMMKMNKTKMMMMKTSAMMIMMMKKPMATMKINARYARAKFTPPPSSKERKTTSSLFARTWSAPKLKGRIIIML